MKRLIFLTCALLVAISAHSQYIINTTALRLLNGSASIAGTIPGTIYYDPATDKFMFREGNTWVMLGSGSGGITNGDKGDITISNLGATMLIDNGAITFAKMQTIPTNTFLGRITAGTGLVESLTPAQAVSMLPVFSSTAKGLVPVPTSTPDGTRYLNDQGTFTVPPGSGGTGTGTTETASNGLYKTGNDIRLGGSNIIEATSIPIIGVGKFKMTSSVFGFGIGSEFFYGGFHLASGDYTARAGQYADAWVDGSGFQVRAKGATGGEVGLTISTTGDMFVIDNRTVKKGLMTQQAGMVTDPRSYADKQYVDQMVAGVSNISQFTTSTSGVVPPSGTSPSTKILYGDGVWRTAPGAGTTYGVFTRSVNGLVPAPGGSTTNRFLNEQGTWVVPPDANTTYGNFNASSSGLVPPSGTANATKVLYDDGVWRVPASASVNVSAGTYTPTYTPFSGSPNGFEAYPQNYSRVGTQVTVSGIIDFNHTTGPVSFKMTLPPGITPSFQAIYSASGNAVGYDGTQYIISAEASGGNEVYFQTTFGASDPGTSSELHYTFMYRCAP